MYVDRQTIHEAPARLASAPALWVVDDFVDAGEIAALLEVFGDEALTEARADHFGWDDSGYVAEIAADQHPALAAIMGRIEASLGRRSALTPTLRFRHYPEGCGHPPHVDGYAVGEARLAITALITLIAAEAGGETRFVASLPEPVAVAPRQGRMIAWTSTLPGGEDDPASRHEGAPVVKGAKGVLMAFLYLPLAEHDGALAVGEAAAGGV